MISPSTIDEIRDLPIEEVIARYMGSELKKAGAGYKGCCPLPNHQEKTASFNVSPVRNMFKCFGCGAGGDGITFVMLKENLPFYEACESLAQQHGIDLKLTKSEKTDAQVNEEKEMMALMQLAQKKYVSMIILKA